MDELLKKIQGGFNAYAEMGQPITEEDKNQSANNMRNALIQLAGLPENWKMSKADEKEHFQNLPEAMGMGTLGTVGKGSTAAEALGNATNSGLGKIANVVKPENLGKTIMADGGPTKIIYPKRFQNIWGK